MQDNLCKYLSETQYENLPPVELRHVLGVIRVATPPIWVVL